MGLQEVYMGSPTVPLNLTFNDLEGPPWQATHIQVQIYFKQKERGHKNY